MTVAELCERLRDMPGDAIVTMRVMEPFLSEMPVNCPVMELFRFDRTVYLNGVVQ